MADKNLLATAPTEAGIKASIARFYGGEEKDLVAQEDGTWLVASQKTRAALAGVRVVKQRGRFRFEMV